MALDFGKLSPEDRENALKAFLTLKAQEPRPWEAEAYNKQLPPDHLRHPLPDPVTGQSCGCSGGNYKTWLLMTGRGFGKTLAGAQWILQKAMSSPGIWCAVCAPTFPDIQKVCFEGTTGILNCALKGEIPPNGYNKNNSQIKLRNGSVIQGYTADRPDSIRGANISYCWFDEAGMIRYYEFYEEGLLPAMRGVANPQMLVTTTPKTASGIIRTLLKESVARPELVHLTRAHSKENHKDPGVEDMIRQMEIRFGGNTQLIQQELAGIFLEEVSGALFQQSDLDRHRIFLPTPEVFDKSRVALDKLPEMRQIVIGVDPATKSSRNSDEHGIVVCGEDHNGHLYTLEDCTVQGSVERCLTSIVSAYYRWGAGLVVVEDQVAGDWFKQALYNVDPYVPYKPVHAMRSKRIRAQPLAPLLADGRIHMVSTGARDFETLEEQLLMLTPFDDRERTADDRADAWVWAMTELARMNAVNYKDVLGFVKCESCGNESNTTARSHCQHCGSKLVPKAIAKSRVSHLAVRWSDAYRRHCPQGHEYAARLEKCPECETDYDAYLAQIAQFSGNSPWLNIPAGRNWFRA